MSTSQWYSDAITSIYSRVKAILESKYKKKYPDFNVTDDDAKLGDSKFPTVYIHCRPVDVTRLLEQSIVDSITLSFTVDVIVKNSNTQGKVLCDGIMVDVVNAFKSMQFRATTLPELRNINTDTKRMIAHFNRAIDRNDTI